MINEKDGMGCVSGYMEDSKIYVCEKKKKIPAPQLMAVVNY